jgi:transposase
MNDSKAAFLKEAALSRGDLTDAEWRILNPLLPDRGERGPAVADRRRTINGILWVLRTGAPWRDMPERYGNWNSVFVRFSRWSKLGVWDAAFETGPRPTRNMPSIPRLCGRTNMQPA